MIHFCVFSYNSGHFLRHCVASIAACAPACPITIFDDLSDDPATLAVLAELAPTYTILQPDDDRDSRRKHGRLYHNMQHCFERQLPGTLLCFLQDDMQLVRPIASDEIAVWHTLLQNAQPPRFLHPVFLKGSERRHLADLQVSADGSGYTVARAQRSAGGWYPDILLASVDRLRACNWHFADSERANEQQARSSCAPMLYLKNPFAAWLPNGPAWRGRQQTLALRLAQRLNHCGFHPFTGMDATATQRFRSRPANAAPYADSYLQPDGTPLPQPWRYHPLQGRRLLKWLNSLELKLR